MTDHPIPRRAAEHGLCYRPASSSDTELTHDIYASTRQEELAPTGWSASQVAEFLRSQSEAQQKHYLAHYPDALWLIVSKGAEPVGRLYLEWSERDLRIIDIALLPHYRGRGWGTAVLHDLMEDAGKTGHSVSIHVEKHNPAMGLYLRLGFAFVKSNGVYDFMAWQPGDSNQL